MDLTRENAQSSCQTFMSRAGHTKRWAGKIKISPMAKKKRKLTPEEKAKKKQRQREFMTVFVGGKQKRIKRRQVEGIDVDEFIRRNADPLTLHQNEMWEMIEDADSSINDN